MRSGRLRLTAAALAALSAVYLAQTLSPLRLNNDAIVYLSAAESAAEGRGFLYPGGKIYAPPGYPALLAVLDRAGLGASWSFIGPTEGRPPGGRPSARHSRCSWRWWSARRAG